MSDGANHNNNEEQHNEGHGDPLYHYVFVFGGTIFMVCTDYMFFWRENHLQALIILAAGLSALILHELHRTFLASRSTIAITIILIWGVCALVYLGVGPNRPAETDIHGWLYVGSDTTDKPACITTLPTVIPEQFRDRNRTITVSAGGNKFEIPYFITDNTKLGSDDSAKWNGKTRPIIRIGACTVLSVGRTENGVAINADVIDAEGNLVAHIRNNEFHLVPARYAYTDKSDSTLAVYGHKGDELFWLSYLNPKSVKVRGYFACERYDPIHVTDTEITVGPNHVKGVCGAMDFPEQVGLNVQCPLPNGKPPHGAPTIAGAASCPH